MYSDNPSLANRSAVAGFLDPGGRVSGTAAQQPTNPYDHPKNKKHCMYIDRVEGRRVVGIYLQFTVDIYFNQ